MQMGFHFDQGLCVNCCTCVVACKDWHDVPAGPASYARVRKIEKGKYPEVSVHSMFDACRHCAEPACMAVCPADAISKRDADGIVLVDKDQCLGRDGCGVCREACPYGAPQFGAEDNATMQKCDFCLDRLADNKNPVCVDACIMHALHTGAMEELRARYGDIRQTEGFAPSDKLIPSIIFTPKEDKKGLTVERTVVSPPIS